MLYGEIISAFSQIHTKHINTLCGPNVELLNVRPGGTYSSSAHTVYLCVLYGSENKQRLFPYTA